MKSFFPYRVNQSVFIGNPAAPTTGKIAFQRLRLTNAFKRGSQRVFNELIYALKDLFILLLPV
ncbi:MAG TPA: hypothetical protein VNW04_03315 [Puia sp.]|nr:hypothetical protein [Puia sp.]